MHACVTYIIIILQTNASGTKTEGEKLAKLVVSKDAINSKEEELVGSMKSRLEQGK